MRIRTLLLSPFVFALVVAAGSAHAQDPDAPGGAPPPQQGYVSASAGATFGNETSPAFAVEYADNVGRYAQGYVTFGYFDNIVSDAILADLQDTAAVLTSLTGAPWEFGARDRGVALVVGGKFLVPTGTGIQPYVGGGAGAIKITRTITETFRGNLTRDVTAAGLADPVFANAEFSATKPLVEGIVGVGILAGPTYVDIGYRYRKAFHFTTPVDFGQFSVGIGYRF